MKRIKYTLSDITRALRSKDVPVKDGALYVLLHCKQCFISHLQKSYLCFPLNYFLQQKQQPNTPEIQLTGCTV